MCVDVTASFRAHLETVEVGLSYVAETTVRTFLVCFFSLCPFLEVL